MQESLGRKAFSASIWSAVEKFSIQGIQFVVMLIMARLLTPSDYGIVGMIAIFIAVSNSFVNSGFSQALIRKNDRTEIDNCTVFYFNIFVGIAFYLILFFCSPFIADFYKLPILIPVTRIVGLSLIFNSLSLVQNAFFTININFKTLTKVSLSSAVISGAVGIGMAYYGFGVWALVFQQLLNGFTTTILLWVFSKWRPQLLYSWKSFKNLFGFGSKMLFSGLIDTVYVNIYQLVIGKIYKASDLGYYTRATNFSGFLSTSLTGIIQRVMFPLFSKIQDEDERLRYNYSRVLRILTYVIFPLMTGLAALAKPVVLFLLTEKWLYCAVLMVPLCLSGMWYPVHAINLTLLQVKGRGDLFLKLEIIKKVVGVIILCVTIPLGLYIMCWGMLLSSLISLAINTHYTGKLIGLGYFKQMQDYLPSLLLSLTMGVVVWITIHFLNLSNSFLILIGFTVGLMLYFLMTKIFGLKELKEVISIVKRR